MSPIKKAGIAIVLIGLITQNKLSAQTSYNQGTSIYVNNAVQKANQNDFAGAIDEINKAIAIDSRNPQLYLQAGTFYQRAKNYEKAIELYDQSIALDGRLYIVYGNRANCYDQLNQVPQAAADYDMAVELQPANPLCYYMRANFENKVKNYKQALADFDKAINLAPDKALYYQGRALTYHNLKNTDAEIADYKKVLTIDPKNVVVQTYLNSVYKNAGDTNNMFAGYDMAIKNNPNDKQAYVSRGNAKIKAKQYADAILDFEKVITIDHDYIPAYLGKARVYLALNQKQNAIDAIKPALKIQPADLTVYYMRGDVERQLNMVNEALADLTKVIEGASDKIVLERSADGRATRTATGYDAAAYGTRGQLFLKLRRYPDAMSDFTHGITLQPKNANNYSGRAECELQLHLCAQALADKNKEVEMAPESTVSYTNRSNTELQMGMYEEAIADEAKALQFWPNNEYSYMHLGTIDYWTGDYEGALDYYNKMIQYSHLIQSDKYTFRGLAERHLNKFDEAAADFNKNIEADPTNFYPHLELGELNIETRNYLNGIVELNKALSLNNTSTRAYNSIGYAYFKLGNYPKAVAYYDSAMVKGKKDNYQPYFEYRDEATANPGKPFTHLTWVCPVEDVNKLADGTLRPSTNKVRVRVKIASGTPIQKQNIKLLLNGHTIAADKITVTDAGESKLNNNNGDHEYEYDALVEVPVGNNSIKVTYDNKSSQQLTVQYTTGAKM